MIKITPYTLFFRQLPPAFSGFRIIHLSDLHGVLFGKENKHLIQKIYQTKPHIIVMTGDMADQTKGAIPQLLCLCRKLVQDYPVYYSLGNHEQCLKKDSFDMLTKNLQQLGVILLDNRCCTIYRKGESVQLYGLTTPMISYKRQFGKRLRKVCFSAADTNRALGIPVPHRFTILLAHDPLHYPSYRRWGADLTLSGHIHGGIIRLPGLGGVLSPDITLFPHYDGGHFNENGHHLIVSRGLGNHFLLRINNPPELPIITLKPFDNHSNSGKLTQIRII